MSEMKPVAYATFCDAWITDHTADPIRAEQWREDGHDVKELHIIPADQVLVPRELLERLDSAISTKDSNTASIAISELRTLLLP